MSSELGPPAAAEARPAVEPRWWRGTHGTPSRTAVRRLLLWALAHVYLDAFLSLLVEVRGLVGEGGVLPLAELLELRALAHPGGKKVLAAPNEFRWKPGDLRRAPVVAPHQPRLDWQMWFAALGTCEENPWLVRFMLRLREGAPPVRGLLAHDPFADAPPAFMRAVLHDYRFTSLAERRAYGAWWRREPLGLYCDVMGE